MFRFTIRDLLWLMMVVALGVALWREHALHVQTQQAHAAEVERYEELWQKVNSPFGSEDDLLPRFKRQFPAEVWSR